MNIRSGKNNLSIFTISALLLSVLLSFGYDIYGRQIVKAIYGCKSVKLLNKKTSHPIEHYYVKSDKIFHQVILWIAVGIVFINIVIWAAKKRLLTVLLVNILTVAVLTELLITMELAVPGFPRFGLDNFVRNVYESSYRNIIQLEPAFARYDPVLTYTLKPGTFTFSNREFANDFYVNSLGVRDDEASLLSPEIIVLGDSYAMGWGVGQNETYAELVEKKAGLKTLNTAIASYGTVREMMMLDRTDTSNLKFLIVHYHPNDYDENMAFYKNNNKLPISDEGAYKDTVKYYKKGKRYYPGKYIKYAYDSLSRQMSDRLSGSPATTDRDRAGERESFINAIIHGSHADLSNVKLIVIGPAYFTTELKKNIRSGRYHEFINSMQFIDMPDTEESLCYYKIDAHLTPKGHAELSDEILNILPKK
jgi:hypothetical protein